MRKEELKDIIDSVKRYIELEQMSGTEEFVSETFSGAAPETFSDAISVKENVSGKGATTENVSGKSDSLASLKQQVQTCTKCSLSKTRTNVVFGSGSSKAKLMFVGEAPGRDEDLQGLPFVGRAGQLLTKIIESIGLKREDAYIANILKCRPPQNRNPLPTEIVTCEDYLIKQIELIKPKVICALGKFAAQTLLRSEEPITKLRGKFHDYHGAKLMPTYHPAYLLRNPGGKRFVWEDMKKIRKVLSGK